jgi:hypothetical protein
VPETFDWRASPTLPSAFGWFPFGLRCAAVPPGQRAGRCGGKGGRSLIFRARGRAHKNFIIRAAYAVGSLTVAFSGITVLIARFEESCLHCEHGHDGKCRWKVAPREVRIEPGHPGRQSGPKPERNEGLPGCLAGVLSLCPPLVLVPRLIPASCC